MNKDGFEPNQTLTAEQLAELRRKYSNENTQAQPAKNTKPARTPKHKAQDKQCINKELIHQPSSGE